MSKAEAHSTTKHAGINAFANPGKRMFASVARMRISSQLPSIDDDALDIMHKESTAVGRASGRMQPVLEALRTLRGIDFVAAVTMVAELRGFEAFCTGTRGGSQTCGSHVVLRDQRCLVITSIR